MMGPLRGPLAAAELTKRRGPQLSSVSSVERGVPRPGWAPGRGRSVSVPLVADLDS